MSREEVLFVIVTNIVSIFVLELALLALAPPSFQPPR